MQNIKIRRYRTSDNPIVWKLHRLGLAEIGIKPDSVNPWKNEGSSGLSKKRIWPGNSSGA